MPRQDRPHVVAFRLTPEEHARLLSASSSSGSSPGAWSRGVVLGALGLGPAARSGVSASGPEPQDKPSEEAVARERRSVTAVTRLTPAEGDRLSAQAGDAGLTVSSYLRSIFLGVVPRVRRPLARQAIAALNRIGNNLNQLTRLSHQGVPFSEELLSTQRALYQAVRRLREELEAGEGEA